MSSPIPRDLVAGGILAALGVAWAAQAMLSYDLGTLRRMGPGMFPAALGIMLAGFGVAIGVQSLRAGNRMRFGAISREEIRQGALILVATASFALLVQRTGLFSAIAALSVLAALAGPRRSLAQHLWLAAALCAMAWLIFSLGLGMRVPLLRWPF